MHILIAPNAFKHSLDATDVALAIQKGLMASKLVCTTQIFPVGDGGNGTGALIIEKYKGRSVSLQVQDPLGRPVQASYGLIDNGRTAVIEMADSSGLHLLKASELDPLHATSFGVGQLISDALDKQVQKIIIGLGGSATVDGGSGLLAALGVRFLDHQGHHIMNLPIGLCTLHTIDTSGLDKRLKKCELIVLCDVNNPLLGSNGAAHVFGPQKGANPAMVQLLDEMLLRYAQVIQKTQGVDIISVPSGGVAGGASAGLYGLLGAKLVNGIDYFLTFTAFDQSLAKSHLLVTAEGSIDEQTLQGKGPFGVAKRAKKKGIPVIALAGSIPRVIEPPMDTYFDGLFAIGNAPSSLSEAIPLTAQHLIRTAWQLGNLLALHF